MTPDLRIVYPVAPIVSFIGTQAFSLGCPVLCPSPPGAKQVMWTRVDMQSYNLILFPSFLFFISSSSSSFFLFYVHSFRRLVVKDAVSKVQIYPHQSFGIPYLKFRYIDNTRQSATVGLNRKILDLLTA